MANEVLVASAGGLSVGGKEVIWNGWSGLFWNGRVEGAGNAGFFGRCRCDERNMIGWN